MRALTALLTCMVLGACESESLLDSAWALNARAAPGEASSVIISAGALVDSLEAEGYRVVAESEGSHSSVAGDFAAHEWTLEGRDPELGPVRIILDANADPEAEHHVAFRVRFEGAHRDEARRTFQNRVIALVRPK